MSKSLRDWLQTRKVQCLQHLGPKLFLGLGLTLCGMLAVFPDSVSHMLVVQVRTEAALSRQGEGTLLLKIRLAPGARAALWRANSCGAPDPTEYTVVHSGIYAIPLSEIPGPSDTGTCLASSDGALAIFLPSSAQAR